MWTDTSKPAWMAAMEAAEGLPKPPGPDFSGTMNTLTYAPTAYRPDRIPAQLPSSERSWLKKMGRVRLPWGNTQELAPARFFYKDSPERLRIREQVEREDAEQKANGTYKPRITETEDFHHIYDHQRYRFAQLSAGGRFWTSLYTFGKGGFWFLFPLQIITCLAMALSSDRKSVV